MTDNIEKDIETKSPQFTLYDIMHLILSNWYWFILSLTLCMLGAWLYIRYVRARVPSSQHSATL